MQLSRTQIQIIAAHNCHTCVTLVPIFCYFSLAMANFWEAILESFILNGEFSMESKNHKFSNYSPILNVCIFLIGASQIAWWICYKKHRNSELEKSPWWTKYRPDEFEASHWDYWSWNRRNGQVNIFIFCQYVLIIW